MGNLSKQPQLVQYWDELESFLGLFGLYKKGAESMFISLLI
jgi:hypothetical protein